MNTATIAGLASTLIFAGGTLPMVVRAARTRDVSSYSRMHLFMTNAGNAVHSVYVASLPPGPLWLLHGVYSGVSAFMFAAHVRWAPHRTADRVRVAGGAPVPPGDSLGGGDRVVASHPGWSGSTGTG